VRDTDCGGATQGNGGTGAADRRSGGKSRGRHRRTGGPHDDFGMAQLGYLARGGIGFPFFRQ
jgi:hypothetical protein